MAGQSWWRVSHLLGAAAATTSFALAFGAALPAYAVEHSSESDVAVAEQHQDTGGQADSSKQKDQFGNAVAVEGSEQTETTDVVDGSESRDTTGDSEQKGTGFEIGSGREDVDAAPGTGRGESGATTEGSGSVSTDVNQDVTDKVAADDEAESPSKVTQDGLVTEGGKTYWYENGQKVTSRLVNDGERTYWFEADGTRASYKSIYDPASASWYWVDADGTVGKNKDAWIPESTGSEAGKWVRLKADGTMVKGEDYAKSKDDGNWHWWYFDRVSGAMTKNFAHVTPVNDSGKWVFYDDVMGWMVYGQQYRTDKNDAAKGTYWYYFDDNTGATTYRWKYIGDQAKWVYYDDVNGRMTYRWRVVDNTWTYFDKDTGAKRVASNAAYTAWQNIQNKRSSSNYYIAVDNNTYHTVVFEGSAGNWQPVFDWICAVGRLPHPGGDQTFGITARGEFRVLSKGYIMGQCPYEFYWTEFFNNGVDPSGEGQRFHSILYWDRNHNSLYEDGRGGANTHGCVRLGLDEAKWIYDNIPLGTGVYSYA